MNTTAAIAESDRHGVVPAPHGRGWIRSGATVVTLTAALCAFAVAPAKADAAAAANQYIAPVAVQNLTLPAAPAAPVSSRLDQFDAGLLSLVNGKRQAAGLAPLGEVVGLDSASAQWSQTQVDNGRWATLAQNTDVAAQAAAAGTPAGAAVAQSVAKWYPETVKNADVFALLVQYPDSLAKMMNPAYRYIGIRTAVAADGTSVAALTFTDSADPAQLVDPAAGFKPTGALTGASQDGSVVELSGTAADPDATAGVQVRVQDTLQDGSGSAPVTTSVAVTGGAFDTSLTLTGSGDHRLCATVVNQGAGSDLDLGCVDAQVSGLVGGLQTVVAGRAAADITGWAVDPDAPNAAVTVSVVARTAAGTSTLGNLPANVPVPALAQSFPGVGTDHGFGAAIPAAPGPQTICAMATTVATGHTVQLGCQDVVVAGSIIGSADTLRQSGTNLTATGWGYDQATPTTSLQATIVTSGPLGISTVTVPADVVRPDILRAYPTIGAAHGFSIVVPTMGAGVNKMCVTLAAPNPVSPARTFPCRTITVG